MILKEINNFYSNLYSKKSLRSEDECLQYLASISTPQLSSTDREACEGKITMQNYWEALVSMKDGKSPGNDGLTKEFFVCFLRVLRVIRVIDDILYHAEQENLDGIVFAADMEKAFDSLEHNFIFSTLAKFGFGQKFIQWVRTS